MTTELIIVKLLVNSLKAMYASLSLRRISENFDPVLSFFGEVLAVHLAFCFEFGKSQTIQNVNENLFYISKTDTLVNFQSV